MWRLDTEAALDARTFLSSVRLRTGQGLERVVEHSVSGTRRYRSGSLRIYARGDCDRCGRHVGVCKSRRRSGKPRPQAAAERSEQGGIVHSDSKCGPHGTASLTGMFSKLVRIGSCSGTHLTGVSKDSGQYRNLGVIGRLSAVFTPQYRIYSKTWGNSLLNFVGHERSFPGQPLETACQPSVSQIAGV